MKSLILAFVLAIAVATVVGCAGGSDDAPVGVPDITGVVTSIDVSEENVSFRVVWTESVGPRSDFDAVQVSAGRGLKVKNDGENGGGTDNGTTPRAVEDLEQGDIVDVYLTGPVAESYPVQAEARAVTYRGKHEGALPQVPGLEPPEAVPAP